VAVSCENGNEPSVSIKGGEFLDYLSDYLLLKKYLSWPVLFKLHAPSLIFARDWRMCSVTS
jgi:hypothetical protein